jgi:hypothetical protein
MQRIPGVRVLADALGHRCMERERRVVGVKVKKSLR